MRLLIKKVGKSTYDPETDKISNFWLIGELKNGKEIQMLDNLPYDLRDFVNQELDCLLFMSLSGIQIDNNTKDEPETPILKGTYIGKYEISNKWKIPQYFQLKYDHIEYFHAIKTEYGIFITSPGDIDYYTINEGEEFTFQAIEFEIWTWQPIK